MDELSRNISILLNVDKNFIPKAEYVFRTFGKILGLQPNFYYEYTLDDVHVYYGPPVEDRRPIEIYYNDQAAKFFNKKNKFNDEIYFYNYRNENIPFLFSERGQLFLYTAKSLEIKKDIIASAFFFLSCWQEYTQDKNTQPEQTQESQHKKSKHKGGSKIHLTIQRSWDFENIPVVDRYCDIFQKALETMLPGYQKQMKLPQEKEFAASVSHLLSNEADNRPIRRGKENLSLLARLLRKSADHTSQPDKLITVQHLLTHINKEHRLKSTPEFFLPAESPPPKKELAQKELNSLINLIKSTVPNKTIGIFTNHQIKADKIQETCQKYAEDGFIVEGYYQNCWFHHYHLLMEELEETDIKYDISISYCDTLGYRAGISYPYYPFNIEENKPFNVLEIPQVINNSLFNEIPWTRRCIKNNIDYLIRDAAVYKTHIGMIWNHSRISNINNLKFNYYLKLLKSIIKRKAWLCSPHDIYNHWMDR